MIKPIPKSERQQELVKTLRTLKAIAIGLDRSSERCECCSVINYNNFKEFKIHRNLEGAISRIEKALEELRGNNEHY